MQHKCKVTVIDKKCFDEYQSEYLADPKSGACPFYNIGDEFIFARYGDEDTFWRAGNGTQCAEAWDCISRYIYTALQGGSIMRNWTNDERMMIACCNDGTRPVIFKIQGLDYKVIKLKSICDDKTSHEMKSALELLAGVESVDVRTDKKWIEVFIKKDGQVNDDDLISIINRYCPDAFICID